VLRGRRVVREAQAAVRERRRYPGEDSEFYAVEKSLPRREASETHAAWLERIEKSLNDAQPLREALPLHQRYRFDPDGISAAERDRLRELCRGLSLLTR